MNCLSPTLTTPKIRVILVEIEWAVQYNALSVISKYQVNWHNGIKSNQPLNIERISLYSTLNSELRIFYL
jgi:hypothetical protein